MAQQEQQEDEPAPAAGGVVQQEAAAATGGEERRHQHQQAPAARRGGGRGGGGGGRAQRQQATTTGRGRGRGATRGRGRRAAAGRGSDGTLFAAAFRPEEAEMTDAGMATRIAVREEQIRQEVEAEQPMEQLLEDQRRIGATGVTWRMGPTLRNYGDMSGVERRRTAQRIDAAIDWGRQQQQQEMEGEVVLPPTVSPGMTARAGTSSSGRAMGRCCATACNNPTMELLHRCPECKGFVHIPCVEHFHDTSEDRRFCDSCLRKLKN